MLRQRGGRAPTVRIAHDGLDRLPADPIPAALVADDVSPATSARSNAFAIASVRDRPCATDDDDPWRARRTCFERNERIVHHQDARARTDATHDVADDAGVVFAIDASNTETDRLRPCVVTSVE